MYPWHKRKRDDTIQPHHAAWLDAHPNRTIDWLRERFRDGFDVHHIDGDHGNNDPKNLVLIEHRDHMMLHRNGTRGRGRLCFVRPKNSGRKKKAKIQKPKLIGPQARKEPLPDVSWAHEMASKNEKWRKEKEERARAAKEAAKSINEGLARFAKLLIRDGQRVLLMNDSGKMYGLRPGEVALGVAYSISMDARRHRSRLIKKV